VFIEKYCRFFLPVFCFFLFGCSTKETREELSVVASVGSSAINIEDVYRQLGDSKRDSLSVYRFLSGWVEKELLYQEGLSLGFGTEKALLGKISKYKKDLVVKAFLDTKIGEPPIVERDIKKYYTINKEEFKRKTKEALVSYFSSQVHSEAIKIKKEIKKDRTKKTSKAFSKYNGKRSVFSFGDLPLKINDNVFNKKNFKNGTILGPYYIDDMYYILKIEKVFNVGSFFELEVVYDEIHQRLINKTSILRRRRVVDSLWGAFPVNIDSQKIGGLIN
tara:strand:+ start:261 stop:1088 length:828 start_codon:yes stop_codon:yes gene_type:complete